MRKKSAKYNVSRFVVYVTIENKPFVNDPEGETILRDLIIKGGYSNIESVRSARTLKFVVRAKADQEAKTIVEKLCEELRIFNPVVSNCTVSSAK
jgi:phosphoribosylformylglycinamidine synthase